MLKSSKFTDAICANLDGLSALSKIRPDGYISRILRRPNGIFTLLFALSLPKTRHAIGT